MSRRLGSRGALRVDYVHRTFGDFYADRVDTTTGKVENTDHGVTQVFDLKLVENTDALTRDYDALTLPRQLPGAADRSHGRQRSYTRSRLNGNVTARQSGAAR
jgi:hypothetical protein